MDDESQVSVQRINQLCALLQPGIAEMTLPDIPPVFIVGPPRSGTTLLYQLMAASLDVGYINNFMARFWLAPVVGAYLSAQVLGISKQADVHSDLGRTKGLGGVHEFGYFWKRFFPGKTDYAADIDAESEALLKREVGTMQSVLGKRLVFKNLTCGLRIAPLAKVFGEPVFIEVRRSPLANAMAILKARRKFHGNEDVWWSLEPGNLDELKKLPVPLQLEAQICRLREDISSAVKRTGARHMVVAYEDLCTNTEEILRDLAEFISVLFVAPCEATLTPQFAPEPQTSAEREVYEHFKRVTC